MQPSIVARRDPRLSARIVGAEPLVYTEGASEALDRPPHVRAASGLARVGDALFVVQDDASFVAVRRGERVDAITLPAGAGGRRRFEVALGNKKDKLDLECAVIVELDGRPHVLALGSGSTPVRETIAIVDASSWAVRLRNASELYAALRAERAFSGSELNVEGAVVAEGVLRLFQRGNGAARDGVEALNASVDLALGAFVAWLAGEGPLPPLTRAQAYDLGRERGVSYGFTDATTLPDGRVLFVAGAEDSPDAIEDGEVLGARVGVIDAAGVRFTELLEEDGAPSRAKVEGVVLGDAPDRLLAVTDVDDPDRPAVMFEIALSGPW